MSGGDLTIGYLNRLMYLKASLEPGDFLLGVRDDEPYGFNFQGSEIAPPTIITSGTSYTALSTDTFIAWNSSATSNKSQVIGAGTFAGQTLYIKDAIGTGDVYNIIITFSGCTGDNQSFYIMGAALQSIGLKWDGTSNWMLFA